MSDKKIPTKRMMGVNYEIWFELLGLGKGERLPTKEILTDEVAEAILANLKSAMRMPGEKK